MSRAWETGRVVFWFALIYRLDLKWQLGKRNNNKINTFMQVRSQRRYVQARLYTADSGRERHTQVSLYTLINESVRHLPSPSTLSNTPWTQAGSQPHPQPLDAPLGVNSTMLINYHCWVRWCKLMDRRKAKSVMMMEVWWRNKSQSMMTSYVSMRYVRRMSWWNSGINQRLGRGTGQKC